jgi:two-component system chemotaxis response regulator CheB
MHEKKVYLNSGQMFVGENSEEIFTTLGTCVAFCVFDKKKKIGGMIHYLLPSSDIKTSGQADLLNPLNYAETAIPTLFKELKNRGSAKNDLYVTIIGGNSVGETEIAREIARANVQIALDWVKKLGIAYVHHLSRDEKGQQILFNLATGELLLKKTSSTTAVAGTPSPTPAPKSIPMPKSIPTATVNAAITVKATKKIKVLIVDDSYPIRKILKNLLSESNEFDIVGEAADAEAAEKLRIETNPDVMTLDIHMPNKDGVTYLAELMRQAPMPVIMISDLSLKEAGPVMKALEVGAFDYIQKPGLRELAEVAPQLMSTIKAAFEGRKKIVSLHQKQNRSHKNTTIAIADKIKGFDSKLKLIAIGASTGGTEALREIFKVLPAQTPPIVVVQHMPKLFTAAFAGSLNKQSAIEVKEAEHGDYLKNSTAYIAPGGIQMGIHDKGNGLQIYLRDDPPMNRFKPSVDYMFNSIKELSLKDKLNAALLTGMGEDGARGLLSLRQGGSYTIAQDENTCVVYGMPKAAADRNAAVDILPLEEIAFSLLHSGAKAAKKIA